MNHIQEDILLAYVLEILDSDTERATIDTHCSSCLECRTRLAGMRGDVDIIAGVKPQGRILSSPQIGPRHLSHYGILRAAALIVLGIAIGYGVASRTRHEIPHVGPAYVQVSPPAEATVGSAVSDATEIPLQISK